MFVKEVDLRTVAILFNIFESSRNLLFADFAHNNRFSEPIYGLSFFLLFIHFACCTFASSSYLRLFAPKCTCYKTKWVEYTLIILFVLLWFCMHFCLVKSWVTIKISFFFALQMILFFSFLNGLILKRGMKFVLLFVKRKTLTISKTLAF